MSVFLLGTRRSDVRIVGIRLLVDVTGPALMLPIPSATRMTIPLGIPNVTGFRGLQLVGQTIHIDSKGFAASSGMSFTIE